MPANTRQDTLRVQNPIITDIVRGYSNDEFIGEKLFPSVKVPSMGGKIPTWGKDSFRVYDTARAMRAESNKVASGLFTTTAYQLQEHDQARVLDYLEEKASMIALKTYLAKECMNSILLQKEIAIATAAQTAANYTGSNTATLTDDFWNEAAIDWITELLTIADTVSGTIGKMPNTVVFGKKVWELLKFHPLFQKYLTVSTTTNTQVATTNKLAEILEIPNIYVGKALKSTDGTTLTNIWDNNIIVAYVVPAQSGIERSPLEPCFGYTLTTDGFPYADEYAEEGNKLTVLRATDMYECLFVGNESGYLLKSPIDPSVYSA